MMNEENPPCVVCGCRGNMSCGHEPIDPEWMCALDRAGVCGCCNAEGRHCEGCDPLPYGCGYFPLKEKGQMEDDI